MSDTLEIWSQKIDTHEFYINRKDPLLEADKNTLVFELAELGKLIEPVLLERFILKAFDSCCYRLAGFNQGFSVFYAWHDEMSGTLRMSISSQELETSLPFRCKYQVHSDAKTLAQLIHMSSYQNGLILNEELAFASFEDQDEAAEFVLSVFARLLIGID